MHDSKNSNYATLAAPDIVEPDQRRRSVNYENYCDQSGLRTEAGILSINLVRNGAPALITAPRKFDHDQYVGRQLADVIDSIWRQTMSIVHPMSNLKIPHNSFVVVSDGRKALFLRNAGDEKFPNLKTEEVLADDNPPTHEQGADRPGRTFKRANTNRRAAIAETDLHDREEQRFLRTVADRMERLVREQKPDALVVAAPARALAVLRHQLHPDVRARVILETDKDLTNHPIYEIERHLFGE